MFRSLWWCEYFKKAELYLKVLHWVDWIVGFQRSVDSRKDENFWKDDFSITSRRLSRKSKNRLSNSLSTGLLYNIRNIPKWTLYSYTFFILNNGLESLHSLEVFEHIPHGSFPFVICLVNVSKSADNCGFANMY